MKKKLALKLILLGFLCVAFACGVSMLIDPYNVFHWSRARDNGVEPNKNYVKTQYVLHHPEQYDTFIFGNSRVGSIDASGIGDPCYNMYYKGRRTGAKSGNKCRHSMKIPSAESFLRPRRRHRARPGTQSAMNPVSRRGGSEPIEAFANGSL